MSGCGGDRHGSFKVVVRIGLECAVQEIRRILQPRRILHCNGSRSFLSKSTYAIFSVFAEMQLILFPILVLQVTAMSHLGPRASVFKHLGVVADALRICATFCKRSLFVLTLDLTLSIGICTSSFFNIAPDLGLSGRRLDLHPSIATQPCCAIGGSEYLLRTDLIELIWQCISQAQRLFCQIRTRICTLPV